MLITVMISIVMVACTNEDESSQSGSDYLHTQPIHYDTRQENNERMGTNEKSIGEQGGYPQSEQRGVNAADYEGGYSDPFTNEETELISKKLKQQKDIIQAQVASTEDRIIVAVMLREHFDHNVTSDIDDIEKQVKKIVPNTEKQIIVYTDDVQWDRMKNLNARYKSGKNGDELFNNFLNSSD
ncbi:YhcN/YlaJ family sporulation lipoprotein [Oceanobacillus halophilus]|nr:YhcN/YlaJ family sporulation lipoprotein [Oceanobacillus halophilus]